MGLSGTAGDSARLGLPQYVSYGLGMMGERIFRDAPALLLLVFMTNYLAVPPAVAGIAVFIPKIVVIVVDPLVGVLSDRLRTPWGRRRPLMLAGALLTSLGFIALFYVPALGSPVARAAYVCVILTLAFAACSLYSVPYLTMAAEIAQTDAERTRLMSWRIVFLACGLTVGAYAGGLIEALGGDIAGYRVMALILGVLCALTMLATVVLTGWVRTGDAPSGSVSILRQLQDAWANAQYRNLLVLNFCQKLGEGIGYGSFAYFVIYVVHQPLSVMGTVVLCAMTAQVMSQPFWVWLNGRVSRETIYILGVASWCMNLLLWLAMDGAPYWMLGLVGLHAGFSAGGFLTVTLAMLTDAIAADTAVTGRNREGAYTGIWLATEKVAFALGALVVAALLAAFGFVEGEGGRQVQQQPAVIWGIAFIYVGLNAIVYCASFVPVLRSRRVARPLAASA
jgi:GPH family glycoside/pentoside/hexuronide:cation symporter